MGMFEENAEWMAQRLGKFTGSEINRLLAAGRRDMTKEELAEYLQANPKGKRKTIDVWPGDKANTYIREKFGEIIRQEPAKDPNFSTMKQLEWGHANEHEAMLFYQTVTGFTVDYYGGVNPRFLPMPGFEDWAGVSLDAQVPGVKNIEFKCPFSAAVHDRYMEFTSAADLMDECPDYFAQIQMGQICARLSLTDFVSFDPRPIEEKYRMKILPVATDEAYCKHLISCLEKGIELLKKRLKSEPFIMLAEHDSEVDATIITKG